MATTTNLYLGVLQHNVSTGEFLWYYGTVEVKETPKQYRMLAEADSSTWYSSYEGQTFRKEDIEIMGDFMGYKGQFSLEDNEKSVKGSIRSDLLTRKQALINRLSRSVERGNTGNHWEKEIETLDRALTVLG